MACAAMPGIVELLCAYMHRINSSSVAVIKWCSGHKLTGKHLSDTLFGRNRHYKVGRTRKEAGV